MTRHRLRARALAVSLALSVTFALGCHGREERSEHAAAQVVDVELMAFLSEARAIHHQANLKEASNDLPGATAAIQRLLSARRPHERAAIPEVEEVLADAYARLSELHLRQGALEPAAEAVSNGLGHAREPTYFRGHLIELEGLVEEARATRLADAGRSEEAAQTRAKAIQLFEQVVRIQDQVIQRSLTAPDASAAEGAR